jgi:hypothetical protein
MAKDDLKNLHPEDRIKKLKKLEAEKKKEIAEAEKEIKKSQDEITQRRKWVDKVPIPEFARENLEGLSEEGKTILKQKGVKEKIENDVEVPQRKKEISLEESVAQEEVNIPKGHVDVQYGPPGQAAEVRYGIQSERPMKDLYTEAVELKQAIDVKGYVSKADEKKAQYLSSVAQERIGGGTYSFTEDTRRAGSLTQMIGASIRNEYQSHSRKGGNPNYQ